MEVEVREPVQRVFRRPVDRRVDIVPSAAAARIIEKGADPRCGVRKEHHCHGGYALVSLKAPVSMLICTVLLADRKMPSSLINASGTPLEVKNAVCPAMRPMRVGCAGLAGTSRNRVAA